jgi:hypothetical protein
VTYVLASPVAQARKADWVMVEWSSPLPLWALTNAAVVKKTVERKDERRMLEDRCRGRVYPG